MKRLRVLFVLVCNVGLVPSEDATGQEIQTHIERLHEKLLSADVYDKTLRPLPISNDTTATMVEASFPHRHIVSVELDEGWLTVVGPLILVWTDGALAWNSSEYGGLTTLDVQASEIWTPDLQVVNANPEDLQIDYNDVYLENTGMIFQVSPYTRIRVPCPMDLTDFPMDEHTCKVRFSSLAYSNDMQQYDTVADLAENALTSNGPWQDHQWEVTVLPMWGSGELLNRTYLELTFRLRRRSSEYLYSVTLPWVSSVVLMLLVFWLPANSSRRLTLCYINMLLLALMLRRMVPLLSDSYRPPKIIFFLEGAMLLQALVTAIAVAFLNVTSAHVLFPVAVPAPVIHFLTGSAGAGLCLRHHDLTRHGAAHTAPTAGADEPSLQKPVTRLSEERAREWLLVAHALDRLFVVVFLVAAVCVMPL
ncbi:neuronal acetylcholine receptor subunit beta-4 isoform X1 [Rhipicephalus microplus]|uniref:neuronal acetylcholine receptor subunit beta-4 isoform X1 n=1 Tax=Rhipicephalus microplus TaxID=6941 RepID=UPI003F6C5EF1